MKYIFVAGAPGSKWSSVVKNIYYSPSVDQSDYSQERTYHHDASGTMQLMHLGAYYDPGMEFGDFFDDLEHYSKEMCEREFDRAFSGHGVRIIKSHVFCHKIDFLRTHWPECPIITVHRPNDACLGWWVRCGEFYITYPTYYDYYTDLPHMAKRIDNQNKDLLDALSRHKSQFVYDNYDLAEALGIEFPPAEYEQDYQAADVTVKVIS